MKHIIKFLFLLFIPILINAQVDYIQNNLLPFTQQGRLTNSGNAILNDGGIKVTILEPIAPTILNGTYNLRIIIEPGDSWTNEAGTGIPKEIHGLGASQLIVNVNKNNVTIGNPKLIIDGETVAETIVGGILDLVTLGIGSSFTGIIKDAVRDVATDVATKAAFSGFQPTSVVFLDTPNDFVNQDLEQLRIVFGGGASLFSLSFADKIEIIVPLTFHNEGINSISIYPDIRADVKVLPSNPITIGFTTQFEYRRQYIFETEVLNAELPINEAYIVTIDGLNFLNYFKNDVDAQDINDSYLYWALKDLFPGISETNLRPFLWNRDANETDVHVDKLREHLRRVSKEAKENNKKMIVVSHSWGTFLAYMALYFEALETDLIETDLLITLSSPLGTPYAGTAGLLPGELAVEAEVLIWKTRLGYKTVKQLNSSTKKWINYWAWPDFISGPLTKFDKKITEDKRVDEAVKLPNFRNDTVLMWLWHKYTSLYNSSIDNRNLLDDIEYQILKVLEEKNEIEGIDVALVLDRSGSMGGDPIVKAKNAASNFVNLMQTGDQVAVVSFSYGGTVNFPLTSIVSDATRIDARNAISQINASGGTGIGSGIQTAQNELNKGNTSKRQGMVLLSDGGENYSPYVSEVLPSIPQSTGIYTIGLGSSVDAVLLNEIAVKTNAFYTAAPTAGDLQRIYNDIRAGLSGQQIVQSTTGNINVNQTNSHSVFVDNSITNITFSTVWAGSDLDLTLEDPNGNAIDANNVNSLNGFFTSGNTYEYFIIPNPTTGEWKMKVLGVDVPTQDYEYSVSASANTNLSLVTSFDQQLYGNGWPILITAELKENQNPTTGALVFAEVTTPVNPIPGSITLTEMSTTGKNGGDETESVSSSVKLIKKGNQYYGTDGILYYDAEMIQLFDDGQHNDRNANDGYYAATYTNTTQPGSYTFKVTAEGNNQSGQKFTRQSTQSTVVDPVQTPSIPILIAPSDGSTVNSTNATFEWQASINGETYNLQVAEDQTFTTANFEETNIAALTKSIANLEKDKTYFWRVSASNSSGTSGWSQVWSFNTSNLTQYNVSYTVSVESTCMDQPYVTQTDALKTGEDFLVEPYTLPQFASTWQPVYDALVGTKFMIENGALDENIKLDIRVKQLDCENPGSYKDPSTFHNPLFMFLGIKVTGEKSGVTDLSDFYYFKNNKKAKICIPHNQAFLDLLGELNINVDDIDFAYYLSDQYFKDGITQAKIAGKNGDVDSTCIYLEHFSQIVGGIFSKITEVDDFEIKIPTSYQLSQNYPNPFNPRTKITYAIPQQSHVTLKVYDVLGKEVVTLVNENKSAGNYKVTFDASNLPSGVYVYRLQAGEFVETKKLVVMK